MDELDQSLRSYGGKLIIKVGDAVQIFTELKEKHSFNKLYSHQETWNGWPFLREVEVRAWAKKNNWEFRLKYINQNDKRFPPGYNMYLRILSETGLIGLLFFGLIILQIFLWCYNNFKSENSILAFIIFISMIGFSLNWLKMDSFRIYFFWLCLSLIWTIELRKKTENG